MIPTMQGMVESISPAVQCRTDRMRYSQRRGNEEQSPEGNSRNDAHGSAFSPVRRHDEAAATQQRAPQDQPILEPRPKPGSAMGAAGLARAVLASLARRYDASSLTGNPV